ncbi:MAG: 5'-methylthioadenosine/adenosylhomocysteine nucleosidase [candidate division Zixibacteria bacterium]|nr:5'-methylthioadenosine/adenosylhomocysteine nucleosidase [candidate division Zixibacteria bacterium]
MIGLISAMEEELVRLRDRFEPDQVVKQAGLEFFFGELAGQKVVLLRCGVGKVNAAVATQLLIDRFGVDAVIFTGLAGSLVPHLKRGDVIVSNMVVQHDIDLTAFGRRPGEIPDLARMIEADPKLIHLAAEATEAVIAESGETRQMTVGTIATGDSFVSDPERIRWLQREFGAIVTEMEGGAVGQVCQMNRVPFVVIRVISDGAGGGAAGEFIMFLDEASDLTCRIVTKSLAMISEEKTKSSLLPA